MIFKSLFHIKCNFFFLYPQSNRNARNRPMFHKSPWSLLFLEETKFLPKQKKNSRNNLITHSRPEVCSHSVQLLHNVIFKAALSNYGCIFHISCSSSLLLQCHLVTNIHFLEKQLLFLRKLHSATGQKIFSH